MCKENDIAVVTTASGKTYVGVYLLAPGIDYFWKPVIPGTGSNQIVDPDMSAVVIGRAL
jgi:hypothetical protein